MKRQFIAILLTTAAVARAATACDMHHAHHATTAPPKTTARAVHDIPDVKVKTQDGRTVSFYSDLLKGRLVAVNFVYTSCTTVCPPMGALFGSLQKQNPGADVHLISVSIDPANDTPERLAKWSQKFGARPGWTLVTGSKDDITKLLKAMDVYVPNFADHQPVTLIGNDATGEWKRTYGFSSAAKLAQMIAEVRSHKDHVR